MTITAVDDEVKKVVGKIDKDRFETEDRTICILSVVKVDQVIVGGRVLSQRI